MYTLLIYIFQMENMDLRPRMYLAIRNSISVVKILNYNNWLSTFGVLTYYKNRPYRQCFTCTYYVTLYECYPT